ncbi:MAG TPA: VPA1262 family N-terminal domain-containing protein [Xanthomonadaceae bacterium]
MTELCPANPAKKALRQSGFSVKETVDSTNGTAKYHMTLTSFSSRSRSLRRSLLALQTNEYIFEDSMDHAKRRSNMLEAVSSIKRLLEPGLLGNYTWFDAIEVIAFDVGADSAKTPPRNIFSVYTAESGDLPPIPESSFLSKKSKRLKKLKTWNVRVSRRPVSISAVLASIEQYGRTAQWSTHDQSSLRVGELVASPPLFCPPDSHTEAPLNAVLKNNFWSGSYVIELKDHHKSALKSLVETDAAIEELSDWLTTLLPLNIERVPDRIGDVLFQIPSNALIAEYRRLPNGAVDLQMDWHPDIAARTVIGEYRVEHDGLISPLERFELPVGVTRLEVPSTPGNLRFSVWDAQKQILLAATAPTYIYGGKSRFETYWSAGLSQPRRFKVKCPTQAFVTHEVILSASDRAKRKNGQSSYHQAVNWQASRELNTRMRSLISSRRFVQYGVGSSSIEAEHERALGDIRYLIRTVNRGAIYLWDPFLSADDLLKTLAFCTDADTELLALTSSKPFSLAKEKRTKKTCSKCGEDFEDGDRAEDETSVAATTRRQAWIKDQRATLESAFIGPSNMQLEFRMCWGMPGFHDRFLMFPGLERDQTRVWSLGASINQIGKEHCIVQEVAHPEPVLQAFMHFWDLCNMSQHMIWKNP